jgi:hypothetical protein
VIVYNDKRELCFWCGYKGHKASAFEEKNKDNNEIKEGDMMHMQQQQLS